MENQFTRKIIVEFADAITWCIPLNQTLMECLKEEGVGEAQMDRIRLKTKQWVMSAHELLTEIRDMVANDGK